jgi:hypothetical protein
VDEWWLMSSAISLCDAKSSRTSLKLVLQVRWVSRLLETPAENCIFVKS